MKLRNDIENKDVKEIKEIENEKRRRFFELSGKYGFTAAMVAATAGTLMSPEAAAQTAREEKEREDAAQYQAIIATAYRLEQQIGLPIAVFRTSPTARFTSRWPQTRCSVAAPSLPRRRRRTPFKSVNTRSPISRRTRRRSI